VEAAYNDDTRLAQRDGEIVRLQDQAARAPDRAKPCKRADAQRRALPNCRDAVGRCIEVVNLAENGYGYGQGREELVADLVAIVSSFCARLYGQRRAKRTTETSMRHLTSQQSPGEREGEGVEDTPG
jgi:hypothetical protein